MARKKRKSTRDTSIDVGPWPWWVYLVVYGGGAILLGKVAQAQAANLKGYVPPVVDDFHYDPRPDRIRRRAPSAFSGIDQGDLIRRRARSAFGDLSNRWAPTGLGTIPPIAGKRPSFFRRVTRAMGDCNCSREEMT